MRVNKLREFEIKAGDTGPRIETVLLDGTGTPIDLTDLVSLGFTMTLESFPHTVVLDAASADFTADETGAVWYDWGPTDTSVPGSYKIEWTLIFPGNIVMTVPSSGFDRVVVNPRAS